MSAGNIALIGKKLGMSTIFEGVKAVPVTLIEVMPNTVLDKKSYNGFSSVVLAGGDLVKKVKINKPQQKSVLDAGLFKEEKDSCSVIKEFALEANLESLKVGQKFPVGDFLLNAIIDVRSVSKGKGFQGGIKRWGFSGMNASHGVSLTHRSIGSTGNRSLPGKVFKNKKMPGHMGARNVCVQNMVIKYVDLNSNIIAVQGSVPGGKNSTVFIINAVKQFNATNNCLNGLTLS
jgi:large subunit ribosomal protein L3